MLVEVLEHRAVCADFFYSLATSEQSVRRIVNAAKFIVI